jgi:hypothetical protein
MSPYFSSAATRLRSPYFKYCFPPDLKSTKFAPGWQLMPFLMRLRSFSMLCLLADADVSSQHRCSDNLQTHLNTCSGKVSVVATCTGTPTSSMRRFGSGEMTVRPLKSTRLPAGASPWSQRSAHAACAQTPQRHTATRQHT